MPARLVASLVLLARVGPSRQECQDNRCEPGSCIGRAICCPGRGDDCPCCSAHQHSPHGHNPHGHNPHSHHPQPASWPTFTSAAHLQASPWAKYYQAVYSGLPDAFPWAVGSAWLLYDGALIKAGVQNIPSATTCPTDLLDRYTTNDMYQPPLVSWIWHAYPYSAAAANTLVEVLHEADPFGDEHFGMWMVFAPGSGIWFNLGVTISFAEHADAYSHFQVAAGGDMNEELSKAAAAAGFDSIQFLAHVDHTNYQCDTHNTGHPGFDYMGVEVLAVKLTGTYPCGTSTGAPASIRAGWEGSRQCDCNPKAQFLNCNGVPSLEDEVVPVAAPRAASVEYKLK